MQTVIDLNSVKLSARPDGLQGSLTRDGMRLVLAQEVGSRCGLPLEDGNRFVDGLQTSCMLLRKLLKENERGFMVETPQALQAFVLPFPKNQRRHVSS